LAKAEAKTQKDRFFPIFIRVATVFLKMLEILKIYKNFEQVPVRPVY